MFILTTAPATTASGIADVSGDSVSTASTAPPSTSTSTPPPTSPGDQRGFNDLDTVDYIIIGVTCGCFALIVIGIAIIVVRNNRRLVGWNLLAVGLCTNGAL